MFSIIIPLYNKTQYILRALNSVLDQSFTDWELIIVDDGSKDDGPIKVLPYLSEKIHLVSQENCGVSCARNNGISKAKYPYICFLDADDFWHQDYLSVAKNIIVLNSFPGFIASNFVTFKNYEKRNEFEKVEINSEFKILGIKPFFDDYLLNTLFFTSSIIIKKDFFLTNAGFDINLKFGEDLDVWFRTILFYKKIIYITSPLVYYSREDVFSATKQSYYLSQTLIPKILDKKSYDLNNIEGQEAQKAFSSFRIKWIYLRLFPLFLNKENKKPIGELLKKLPNQFMSIGIFYRLPFDFFYFLIKKNRIRNYFKKHIERSYKTIYKS